MLTTKLPNATHRLNLGQFAVFCVRTAMVGVQEGLEVAFYLLPCGLFATLLVSQSVAYYLERRRASSTAATESNRTPEDEKQAEKSRRVYDRLIWAVQAVLSALLASGGLSTGSVYLNRRTDFCHAAPQHRSRCA